jgi:integrase
MARPHKPQWHGPRHCWKAAVGGKTRYFAKGVLPSERPQHVGIPQRAWDALTELLRAEESDVAPGAGLTVEGLCESYLAWADGRAEESKLDRQHARNKALHLTKFAARFGDRPADAMEAADVTRFLDALTDEYAPTYVANIGSTISAAFHWGVERKYLPANPVKGFATPTVPRAPERYAERAEAAAFLGHWRTRSDRRTITGRYDRLTLLMQRVLIRTGARPMELCRLRWTDLRWDGGTTTAGHRYAKAVLPPVREDRSLGHKTGRTTGKPRTIYLTPTLTRALLRVRDRPGAHPVYPFVHGRGRGGVGAGEPWKGGGPLSKATLRVRRELIAWQAAIRAAGAAQPWEARRAAVEVQDKGANRLVNYRWRHTSISTLLMMGVDVPTVAELVGTSPAMIYQNYGHLLADHLAAAAEKQAQGRRRS